MPQTRHVVVDGSNIATEGRSMPSLAQLDEAVRAFMEEFPDAVITVVVDATFGHRIDPSEVPAFDEAVANNEIVSPPAGAFGRGDAFLLRIAEKVDADVLSNDSFQEFHGEHEWLFDRGRLIGGKPVPGVGWIFTARSPVRGPKSREAMRRAGQGRSPAVSAAIKTATDEATSAGRKRGTRGGRGRRPEVTEKGPEEPKVGDVRLAPLSAEEIEKSNHDRRRRRGAVPSDPVNEPMVFLGFVASHRPGATVEGVVEEFTSHGAFVRVGEAKCYLPLSAMGDPPPRAARDAVHKGTTYAFIVQALDPPRRGIEIALPEFAKPAGAPSDETVEQEINATKKPSKRAPAKKAVAKKTTKKAAQPAISPAVAFEEPAGALEPTKKPSRRSTKKAAEPVAAEAAEPVAAAATPAKKSAAAKKTPAKKAAAPKKVATKKEAAPKKAAAKKEAAPKKAAAKKEALAKKAPAKKAVAKKTTAKKAATEPTAE
jgi:hypothetical protein